MELRITKYHEAVTVNMAIEYAISRPFWGIHTPRSCMLSTVAGVLYKTRNRCWDMNKELEGWEMGGRPELLPFVDDDVDENSDEWCSLGLLGVAALFCSGAMHRVSASSSCPSPRKEVVSKVKKEECDFETCHDRKAGKMAQKKERYNKNKPQWRQLAGREVGQSSHDNWRSTKPQGKWKEISAEIDAVGTIVKEKTNTWNKSCKERAKRESESFKMIDERQEHKERSMLKDLLLQLQKEREARGLIEEVQRNLDEAQARASENERKLGRVLGEYMYSNEKEMERPHYIMDKMWQMMQSEDTKTLNLDKGLEEMMKKV